ncbi:MAG: O-methyltransferase [Lachnospiraceae bacterium]|nr:O-methyltransferase [Lachnospiraceae bacterium]
MITKERIAAYIDSLDTGNIQILNEIEEEALNDQVPVIRRETQNLLRLLLAIQKPGKILEVGTAVGFSAILMAKYGPEGCRVTTIENYEKRFAKAEANFERAGCADRISFLKGDAQIILQDLKEQGNQYDLIFMDAAKGQYLSFYEPVRAMMHEGSMLVSDNVLQDGDVVESRFAVNRRNRTIHSRMREYLYMLTHTEELVTDILPLGDGVAVSVLKAASGEEKGC